MLSNCCLPVENMSIEDVGGYDPCTGEIKSSFGQIWSRTEDGTLRCHEGIDIFAFIGTRVKTVLDGEVVDSRQCDLSGGIVTIKHDSNLVTRYIHLCDLGVRVGMVVKKGQQIASVKSINGKSPHLHFEVLTKDVNSLEQNKFIPVDPFPYIKNNLSWSKNNQSLNSYENRFDRLIKYNAKKIKIDPYIVKALIKIESGFKSCIISCDGHKTKGLMQLKDSTFDEMANKYPSFFGEDISIFDPESNIIAGMLYLNYLKTCLRSMFGNKKGVTRIVLTAYNYGSNNVSQQFKKIKGDYSWEKFSIILNTALPGKAKKIIRYVDNVLYLRDIYRYRDMQFQLHSGNCPKLKAGYFFFSLKMIEIRCKQYHQKKLAGYTPRSKISRHLIHCLIAAEDKRFYKHYGIDPIGIGRALIHTVFFKKIEGGSTITQQMVRTAVLAKGFSFKRKFQEITLSLLIERILEKDEIIEMYMNNAYFGTNCVGLRNTSRSLFDKDPELLNLQQCAFIISLLKVPLPKSSDDNKLKRIILRQRYILKRMYELDFITDMEYGGLLEESPTDIALA